MSINYYSTNHGLKGGFKGKASFREALFTGMAPDNGLFMPERIPRVSREEILAMKKKPYHMFSKT